MISTPLPPLSPLHTPHHSMQQQQHTMIPMNQMGNLMNPMNHTHTTTLMYTNNIPPVTESLVDSHPSYGTKEESISDNYVETNTIESRGKRNSSISSNKRGKKHFQGSIDEDLDKAAQINKPVETGLRVYSTSTGGKCFYVIDEDLFYNWIRNQRPGYSLEKASLFEKLNKSRGCNRVNPRAKSGRMAIKYLRIDTNPQEFGKHIETDMEAIRQDEFYKNCRLRIYSHRDWNYIPESFFYYEKKN